MGVAKEVVDGFRASRGSAATGVEGGADGKSRSERDRGGMANFSHCV